MYIQCYDSLNWKMEQNTRNLSSREGNQGTFEMQVCVSSSNEIHAMRFLVALNILLSLSSSLGNAIILVALKKETTLHAPSKLLYICLVSTDLCVGFLLQPLNVVHLISAMQGHHQLCSRMLVANYLVGMVLFGVSLSTLTGISVDRLLALLLKLRYRQVVTLTRSRLAVTLMWLLNIFVATMYFWVHFIFLWYGYILIAVCVVITTSSYTKIYATLRRHQTSAQNRAIQRRQSAGKLHLNTTRYRKTVSAALWVQLTLVARFLPYAVVTALMGSYGLSPSIILAGRAASTLVYLNSTLNPFLYCWKIREVRQVVKGTVGQLCFSSRVQAFASNTSTMESTC